MWTKRILAVSRARESARLVLLALGAAASRDGICELSVPDLARLCLISERQVQYALADLVKLGELEVASKGGGRGRATKHRILLPWPPGVRFWGSKEVQERYLKRVQSTKGV